MLNRFHIAAGIFLAAINVLPAFALPCDTAYKQFRKQLLTAGWTQWIVSKQSGSTSPTIPSYVLRLVRMLDSLIGRIREPTPLAVHDLGT